MVTAILGREINGIFSVLVIEKRDDAYRGRQASKRHQNGTDDFSVNAFICTFPLSFFVHGEG